MTDYISRGSALEVRVSEGINDDGILFVPYEDVTRYLQNLPAADVVPWNFLERYAEFFCAVVSMPEFVREAKAFYQSTCRAEDGGKINA